MNDYCFALQSYPKCHYEQLRNFLELPCKRKLQYITSSIDKDQVLRETFDKVQTLQLKNVFLLVGEVQICPTVSISGGLLSGMAENMSILSILTTTLTQFAVNPTNLLSTPQRKTSRRMQSFRPLSRWPGSKLDITVSILFSVHYDRTWNQLPENIDFTGTVNTFKNRLDIYSIRNPQFHVVHNSWGLSIYVCGVFA
ncbi:hypothetical protein FHG87_023473 [Trinorchestia longiramus]|nr:hypothetical protein FHG87_023473 [Trinorchestia longiramus]